METRKQRIYRKMEEESEGHFRGETSYGADLPEKSVSHRIAEREASRKGKNYFGEEEMSSGKQDLWIHRNPAWGIKLNNRRRR
jgi:hypothetical protein